MVLPKAEKDPQVESGICICIYTGCVYMQANQHHGISINSMDTHVRNMDTL